jgi:hypothetical protein
MKDEIGEAKAFFAGDRASCTAGQGLGVSGGLTMAG